MEVAMMPRNGTRLSFAALLLFAGLLSATQVGAQTKPVLIGKPIPSKGKQSLITGITPKLGVSLKTDLTFLKPVMLGALPITRTCQIQIEDEINDTTYPKFHPQSTVSWDWSHKTGLIRFQWFDSNPKTTSVTWQVSAARFSDTVKNWELPVGIVARGTSARAADWTTFSIVFWKFAPVPAEYADWEQTGSTTSQPSPAKPKGFVGNIKQGPLMKPLHALKYKDIVGLELISNSAAALKARPITGPISLFVRAVPLDGNGNPTGYASAPIEILWGPQPTAQVDLSNPPPAVHPTVKFISYEPIRWPGNPYLMLCTEDVPSTDSQTMKKGSMFKKGTEYDFTPRPDSPFETFINSWGDLFSFIGEVFNWVAEMYNGIKSMVCDWIADQLGGWAGFITNMGLTWGMTALGMPPTLPTLDELESMGTEYLARTVQEQAVAAGVPEMTIDLAREAAERFGDDAKKAAMGEGGSQGMFIPATSQRFRPAILMLEVRNDGSEPTTAMDLKIDYSTYVPDWKVIGEMTENYYPDPGQYPPMQVFRTASIHLPSLEPGGHMRVPVCPEPTYDVQRITESVADAQGWASWIYGYHRQQSMGIKTVFRDLRPQGQDNIKAHLSMNFTPDTAVGP
jgi:hypothetical protein